MKIKLYSLAFAILTASAVIAADTKITETKTTKPDGSTETTVTTSSGTISEYVPGTTFIVKETTGPVSYVYGKTVKYVTKSGEVLTDNVVTERIKTGANVSVHYVMDGANRVINKVVVDD